MKWSDNFVLSCISLEPLWTPNISTVRSRVLWYKGYRPEWSRNDSLTDGTINGVSVVRQVGCLNREWTACWLRGRVTCVRRARCGRGRTNGRERTRESLWAPERLVDANGRLNAANVTHTRSRSQYTICVQGVCFFCFLF